MNTISHECNCTVSVFSLVWFIITFKFIEGKRNKQERKKQEEHWNKKRHDYLIHKNEDGPSDVDCR